MGLVGEALERPDHLLDQVVRRGGPGGDADAEAPVGWEPAGRGDFGLRGDLPVPSHSAKWHISGVVVCEANSSLKRASCHGSSEPGMGSTSAAAGPA